MTSMTRLAAVALVPGFLAGCTADMLQPASLDQACSAPAPLLGTRNEAAPRYIVVFHAGIDAAEVTQRLAARYGFTPVHVYRYALPGFSAELSAAALSGLRCEAEVEYVEHDGIATVG